jgi:hypothetical protein
MELIEEFLHHRGDKFILDHLLVQCSIIDTEVPGVVLFLHEQYRSKECQGVGTDHAKVQHLIALPLQLLLLACA